MTEYKLVIDTPEGTVYDGDAVSVVFDSEDGSIGILANRSPGIIALFPGKIRIKTLDENELIGATSSGVVVCKKGYVHILTDDMLWEDEIDIERQRLNIKLNRDRLFAEKYMLHRECVLANAAIARASARLKTKGIAPFSTK